MIRDFTPVGRSEYVATAPWDRRFRLHMAAPAPVDPATVRAPGDPIEFLLVNEIEWSRPLYLRIITVILVVLISASASSPRACGR